MKATWTQSLVLVFINIGIFCSMGQGIRIESAYYGAPNRIGVDVTRRVQRFADYGEPFRVGNDTLRIDPSPNHSKALVVIYEVKGRRISDSVREGDVFYFITLVESDGTEDRKPAKRKKMRPSAHLLPLGKSLFTFAAFDDKRVVVTVQRPRAGGHILKIDETPIRQIGVAQF